MEYVDLFTITYHPDPGWYYIHWKSTSIPVNSNQPFRSLKNAERWLKENARSIVDNSFEKELLDEQHDKTGKTR